MRQVEFIVDKLQGVTQEPFVVTPLIEWNNRLAAARKEAQACDGGSEGRDASCRSIRGRTRRERSEHGEQDDAPYGTATGDRKRTAIVRRRGGQAVDHRGSLASLGVVARRGVGASGARDQISA